MQKYKDSAGQIITIKSKIENYEIGISENDKIFIIDKKNFRYYAVKIENIRYGPVIKNNFRWLLFNGENIVGNFELEEDAILLQTQIGGKILRVNMDEAS